MNYRNIVKQIADLPWSTVSPEDVILLSRATAIEFAESLRLALDLHPSDPRLQEMASGELKADNLIFENYSKRGDHWEFLDHYIREKKIETKNERLSDAVEEYTSAVRAMNPEERAMTVFSREEELTSIFRKIVDAHDWDSLGLGFYKYYLESHIEFDSGDKGHHHLTQHFPLHEDVLLRFYQIRLKLYSCLFDKSEANFYESNDFKNSQFKPLNPAFYPPEYQEYIKAETELIKEQIAGKVVLEAGVGIGRLISDLAPIAKEFVGVDNADLMLQESYKRAEGFSNVRLVKSDLENLSQNFPAKYFDISLCVWNTIGNVRDEVTVLSEIAKVTKEKIVVTLHLKGAIEKRKNWYKTVGLPMDKVDEENEIFYNTKSGLRSKAYSLQEITEIAQKAGLSVSDHKIFSGVVLYVELK